MIKLGTSAIAISVSAQCFLIMIISKLCEVHPACYKESIYFNYIMTKNTNFYYAFICNSKKSEFIIFPLSLRNKIHFY